MFKSAFSFFSRGKSRESPESVTSGPQVFTIAGKGTQMLRIQMNDCSEQDGFIDIQTKKLSYAEVARLAPATKKIQVSIPAPGRVHKNKYEVLESDQKEPEDEEFPEKFKTDNHYRNKKKTKSYRK